MAGYDEAVEGRAHVQVGGLPQGHRLDGLGLRPHPGQAHHVRLQAETVTFTELLHHAGQLLTGHRGRHEPGRLEDLPAPGHVLLALLLHLDVQQAERVLASPEVVCYLLEEAVRFPVVSPEGNGDGLPEVVELQTAAPDCRHDARIVDNGDLHLLLPGPQHEVAVGGGSERVSHDQEPDLLVPGLLQEGVGPLLHQFPVREDDLSAVELLQLLLANGEYAGVVLQVDLAGEGQLREEEDFQS